MLIVISLCIACGIGEWIDSLAQPRRAYLAGGPAALGFRMAAVCWIWLVAMAITQRPAFSLLATTVTASIVVTISNLKQKSLREPLVFSDFTFVADVLRHPRLFYLRPWSIAFIAALMVSIVVVTVAWTSFEATAGSPLGRTVLVAFALLLPVLPLLPGPGGFLDRTAAATAPRPRRDAHLASLGLLGSLLVYWIRWLEEGRGDESGTEAVVAALSGDAPYDAIVVVQAESFVDLRRNGIDLALPAYDVLKARALAAGRLEVPCVGAYTLRPEAGVIAGCGFEQAGFAAFHPYLRWRRLAPSALPNRLPAHWRTLFIHPYVRTFFQRDRAIPQFGFDAFIDQSSFTRADREGPYVGDVAVGRRVLDALDAARRDAAKLYVQVVTMEAHDPFEPGRLAHEIDATRQFVHHLGSADRMLGLIATTLDQHAGRTLLVHYGDHVPVLEPFADPSTDSRTDFLVVELGQYARQRRTNRTVERPEHLYALIVDQFEAAAPAP